MGYEQGTLTVHGFRSTASTLLNEQGCNADAIERQLAHAERGGVRAAAAYNYAEYLPERRKMMQAWSDHREPENLYRTRQNLLGAHDRSCQLPACGSANESVGRGSLWPILARRDRIRLDRQCPKS
jgi:hypothetical protein